MSDYQPERHVLVLYDGACGLCHRTIRFLLRHDTAGRFRFAPLQGETAGRLLSGHGERLAQLASLVVVPPSLRGVDGALLRSSGVAYALERLGPPWGRVGKWLRRVPTPVRDAGYRVIAALRYRVFGRDESCPLPAPGQRERFLE